MKRVWLSSVSALAVACVCLITSTALAARHASLSNGAHGQAHVHVVVPGQTIASIAKQYGIDAQSLAHTNHLRSVHTLLKGGLRLQLPKSARVSRGGKETINYVSKPKFPGRLTVVRFATRERHQVQAVTRRGKVIPSALPRMARIFRYGGANLEHSVDPRLVALLAHVSDHFGGRPIEIISGYRPKTRTQFTPHSNHNLGRAIDMRIQGVPNTVLRDFCRTFRNVGVGYYPNSLFVHFDVRRDPAYWVDLSGPGEAPRYVDPNAPLPKAGAKAATDAPLPDAHDHHDHEPGLPKSPSTPLALNQGDAQKPATNAVANPANNLTNKAPSPPTAPAAPASVAVKTP